MKKLNLLFILLGLTAISFLSSCDSDDTEDESPLITITSSGVAGDGTVSAATFSVTVEMEQNPTSKKKIDELLITSTAGLDDVIDINSAQETLLLNYNAPAPGETVTYTFRIQDNGSQSATANLTVKGETVVTTTDLSAATSFTMVRCGNNNDPEIFGLQYDQNSNASTAVIITSTADKLVELSPADWSSFTTQEDLIEAVDNGTSSTTFNLNIGTGTSSSFDKVVATKEGNVYTLINLTGSVTEAGQACGTRVTLNGDYKN